MENVPAAPASNQPPATTAQNTGGMDVKGHAACVSDTGGFDVSPPKKVHPVIEGFQRLSMMRQLWMMVALAASIAIGLGVVLWSQGTNYRPLITSSENYEVHEVIEVLSNA